MQEELIADRTMFDENMRLRDDVMLLAIEVAELLNVIFAGLS